MAAGVLGGLAMAARFPLALATLPVFVLYALARPARLAPALIDRLLTGVLLALALFLGPPWPPCSEAGSSREAR